MALKEITLEGFPNNTAYTVASSDDYGDPAIAEISVGTGSATVKSVNDEPLGHSALEMIQQDAATVIFFGIDDTAANSFTIYALFKLSAIPAAEVQFPIAVRTTSGGAHVTRLQMTTGTEFKIMNTAATAVATTAHGGLTLDKYYLLTWTFSALNGSAGVTALKLYDYSSGTATLVSGSSISATSVVTSGTAGRIRYGKVTGISLPVFQFARIGQNIGSSTEIVPTLSQITGTDSTTFTEGTSQLALNIGVSDSTTFSDSSSLTTGPTPVSGSDSATQSDVSALTIGISVADATVFSETITEQVMDEGQDDTVLTEGTTFVSVTALTSDTATQGDTSNNVASTPVTDSAAQSEGSTGLAAGSTVSDTTTVSEVSALAIVLAASDSATQSDTVTELAQGLSVSDSAVQNDVTTSLPDTTSAFDTAALTDVSALLNNIQGGASASYNAMEAPALGGANPSALSGNADSALTVGLQFTVSQECVAKSIRYWQPSSGTINTNSRQGGIYETPDGLTAGTLHPATAAVPSGSGWQTLQLASEFTLVPGTIYMVAVAFDSPGGYVSTPNFFAGGGPGTGGYTNGPLNILGGAGRNQGAFKYGGLAFPDSSFNSSNYWVDVVTEVPAVLGDGATQGDSSNLTIVLSVNDSATITDLAGSVAAAVAASDSWSLTDLSTLQAGGNISSTDVSTQDELTTALAAVVSASDSAVQSDSSVLDSSSGNVANDSATQGEQTTTLALTSAVSDGNTQADNAVLAVDLAVSDTATQGDSSTLVSGGGFAVSDTFSMAENVSLSTTTTASDSATETDIASLDSGGGGMVSDLTSMTESSAISVTISVSDAATQADSAAYNSFMSVFDDATAAELSAYGAILTATDPSTQSDLADLGDLVQKAVLDGAVLADVQVLSVENTDESGFARLKITHRQFAPPSKTAYAPNGMLLVTAGTPIQTVLMRIFRAAGHQGFRIEWFKDAAQTIPMNELNGKTMTIVVGSNSEKVYSTVCEQNRSTFALSISDTNLAYDLYDGELVGDDGALLNLRIEVSPS